MTGRLYYPLIWTSRTLTGEFLVAEIDAKVGGFGIVPEFLDGAIVSSHYFLFEVDEINLDRRFLDYFTRTPIFREQIEAQGSTNYASIRPSYVMEYEIPLPPLEEQRRIVARIEELAGAIAEARGLRARSIEEREVLKTRIFEIGWSQAASCSSAIWKNLESCANVIDPQPDHRTPPKVETGMPYVSIANIDIDGNVDVLGSRKVSIAAIERQEASFTLSTGDIIIGKIGTVGAARPIIVKQRLALSANVVLVQPDSSKVIKEFILGLLRSPQMKEQFIEGTRRTAQEAFGIKKMRKLLIPVPPINEQRRIVTYLDDLQSKIDALKRLQAETAAELDALLHSILDKAFKGEL